MRLDRVANTTRLSGSKDFNNNNIIIILLVMCYIIIIIISLPNMGPALQLCYFTSW